MSYRRNPRLGVKPSEKHLFVPRQHGSPEACRDCGGAHFDPIHPKEKRRKGDERDPR